MFRVHANTAIVLLIIIVIISNNKDYRLYFEWGKSAMLNMEG